MLRSYLRLVLFGLGLLIGVQWPGFIEAYALRVDAHRQEAELGLQGFRDTAEKFFQGDLERLIAHYRGSDDAVIRSDARSLEHLVQRVELLEREWQAMSGPWYARAWHVAFAADPQLRAETYTGYRYQVLLTPEAIAWGLGAALLLAWLAELLLLSLRRMLVGRPRVSRFS
ncbi:DUF2937 domain-containing protein [Stutzerimonas kirkiae]|uniref:DUF2937 domain-containing protein n=1 Tax=Stutzerimonas kirkiae TaxID=2211392 RepID=A0A4Q9R7Z2_9GAMM|nr:DUF2937 family protein [Stutzerimonas kirkiae]TBU96037.1 DUF2937 domain-containing protein [Stutzerimonas kirkiae]TBV03131.1 DUF2937 domain-containing protein [Stutzerimonas kirkiae]TBV13485.1 DUF2937 domain-containing protein [Stutzerimonas kirkiae]